MPSFLCGATATFQSALKQNLAAKPTEIGSMVMCSKDDLIILKNYSGIISFDKKKHVMSQKRFAQLCVS